MIYLVLYDDAGVCQRVAKTANRLEAQQFIKAGFVEVEKAIYDECAQTAPNTRLKDLAALGAALSVLATILRSRRQVAAKPDEAALRRLQNAFRAVARAEAARVVAGDITVDAWYNTMRQRLKQLHIASAAAATGGLQGFNRAVLEAVERNIAEQLTYLRRFRDDLQQAIDDETVSVNAVGARAAMYGSSSSATFAEAETAAQGIPRLPAYPGVRTECLSNCKCRWRIRQLPGNGNYDCWWVVSPVENCNTCLARQRSFNPLRIRNGVIQPFSTAGIYA
jgi:hypothetical protein